MQNTIMNGLSNNFLGTEGPRLTRILGYGKNRVT